MELIVEPTDTLGGIVKAPPSKSYTIRAVIAGALADGVSTIKDPLFSEDTNACIEICKMVGARISQKNGILSVGGNTGTIQNTGGILDTKNSGTTIRLMTAVVSLSPKKITLTGDESIQQRPMEPLLDALRQLGVKTESRNGYPPVTVEGPIKGGECKIKGDISSQFISGLLMATPLAENDTTIEVTTELKSKPYVDLTLDVLGRFRVGVENQNYMKFVVPSDQKYKATSYTVEGDYSSAAFLLSAGALTNSKVTVTNLLKDSKQADRRIVQIIKEMGARVDTEEDEVTVEGNGRLNGITIDLSNSPDLLPITAVLGACAEGETRIENVAHARLKECDRIKAMATELKKMGCRIEEKRDGLTIQGSKLKGTKLHGWHDHRVIMALGVAGLRSEGTTMVDNAEHISVTFPDFVEMLNQLGADIKTS